MMRAILTASLASAAIGLCAASLSAARAGVAVQQNAISPTQLVQGDCYDGPYYCVRRRACPDRYYYTCWSNPYGYRHCGCRPGFDYYLFRFY